MKRGRQIYTWPNPPVYDPEKREKLKDWLRQCDEAGRAKKGSRRRTPIRPKDSS